MNVKKRIAVIAALTAGAVLAAGYPVALRNAGFHETDGKGGAVGWSAHPNWHAEAAGHNGSGGIVWECASEAESKKGGPCQTVALKPGRRYDFSALVKTENVVTERKSPHQGIGLVVRYYDADGKSMFSDWSTPLANGTSGDWIAVKGITREVPGGVASISFGISTMKCVSGRAVVDNMFIAEHDTPTVAGVFPHVYRCEATGGEVVFSASLNADVCENSLSDYTATFAYVAADGRRASVAGKVVSAVEAMATLDVSRFAAGTNDVVCTLFLKGREVGTASVPFAHLEKPMPRRVFIDRHQRTIVDGKPFFPLGMCYWRKFAKDELDRYAEGPFNCLNSGLGATREDLDLCRERGLMAICRLDSRFDEPDGGLSWLKSEVDALKSHTAVLGWFVSDELPLSYVPMLRRRQSWMEAHDPDHPTWFANDRVHEARSYLGVADVIGVDPYPIPAGRIGIVNETVRAAEVNTLGTMAQWVFPQAFAWGWLNRRETKGQRAPTRKEMANMGWQAIAGGANGLIFYAYQHILEQPHDDPADAFEPAWERTKAMGGEFRKYLDVFLSVDPVPEAKSSNAAVAVRTWRYKGDVYLLAVNCTTDAQTAEISLAEPVRRVVSADFAAVPGVEGGRVRISLGPIDYVMAKLETAGAAASGAGAWKVPKWTTVVTEAGAVQKWIGKTYCGHCQGMCVSSNAIYFSFHDQIVKTDWHGRLMKRKEVASHSGDICLWNGRLYTGVWLAPPKGTGERWCAAIGVYDAETLELVKLAKVPWNCWAADGITAVDGVVYLALGAEGKYDFEKKRCRSCWYCRFDAETLEMIGEPFGVDHGDYSSCGAQNMTTDGRYIYASHYPYDEAKREPNIVVHDKDTFKVVAKHRFGWNTGLDVVPGGKDGAVRFAWCFSPNWTCEENVGNDPRINIYGIVQFLELKDGVVSDFTKHGGGFEKEIER